MISIPADILMNNNFYLLSKQVRVGTIYTHISVGKIYTYDISYHYYYLKKSILDKIKLSFGYCLFNYHVVQSYGS